MAPCSRRRSSWLPAPPALVVVWVGVCAGLRWSEPSSLASSPAASRRDVLRTTTFGSLSVIGAANSPLVIILQPPVAVASPGALDAATQQQEEMRTTANLGSTFESVTGQSRGANLGAGSVSGKSRPVTNVVLADAPEARDGAVYADVVLGGGVVARIAFQTGTTKEEGTLKLAKGFYYDVEARDSKGDSAYLHVVRDAALDADAARLTASIFAPAGRYGAFGAPSGIRVLDDARPTPQRRVLRLAFEAITPGGSQQPREARVAAVRPDGATDVVLLVASASQPRWNAGGDKVAAAVVDSFRVDSVKPTKLAAVDASDYRFEERGGLRAALLGSSSSN